MVGNPICVQIPWDSNAEALTKWANVSILNRASFSRIVFIIRYHIISRITEIINWKRFVLKGQTGFPWIDAIMTQLREEGWIHHLARHAVACFLTRGDLWISWEEGMKVLLLLSSIVTIVIELSLGNSSYTTSSIVFVSNTISMGTSIELVGLVCCSGV